ncbi:MAG: DUF5343 domain-containing protein [Planctomycetaceae bacterium]|nr:DUF5343 domain-containing protein [Planctomycetaceae bacterium]
MSTAETSPKVLPAYVGYVTFANFIGSLKASGVPSRIDKSVMKGLAGGVQSHLASAMKFLGLVNESNSPLPLLHSLAGAHGTDQWPAALKEVVALAYSDIVDGIDLTKASPQQLVETFRENSEAKGATADKAIRFYLQAVKDAKIEIGPHLANMKITTPYNRGLKPAKATKKNAESVEQSGADGKPAAAAVKQQEVPTGMTSQPIQFKRLKPDGTVFMLTGSIVFPESVTMADCKRIDAMVAYIKTMASEDDE